MTIFKERDHDLVTDAVERYAEPGDIAFAQEVGELVHDLVTQGSIEGIADADPETAEVAATHAVSIAIAYLRSRHLIDDVSMPRGVFNDTVVGSGRPGPLGPNF